VTIGRQAMAATGYEDGDLVHDAIELLREHRLAVERRPLAKDVVLINPTAVSQRPPEAERS
jgi:hypothetical protein